MRVEEHQEMPDNLFGGDGEIETLLQSHDWSQTPLGAVETWSESLKTAVQSRLVELNQAQRPEQVQQASALPSQNCTQIATFQAAQADAFRVALANALCLLTDANEIQATAARMLGERLGASRVIYAEVLPGGKDVIVHNNYTNGVAELSGQYRLDEFGRNLTDDHRAGQTAIVPDVANSLTHTDSEKAMYRAIDVAAHLDVPLIKNDQFVALLAVHQATPRQWTEREVKWVEETAAQTWATVERARAEAGLRESEAKYRLLFESIDEGFCTVEVLFDADGKPVDHLILQANPAFERQTGIANSEGKRASELVPGVEQYWHDLYAQVIHTGESIRTEERVNPLDRWFDVLISRAGDAAMRQVAIVFTDIHNRKQAEEALQESEKQSRNILESITEAFFALDDNWQFTYVNQAAEKLLDRSPRDLIGKNFWEEFPGLADTDFGQLHLRVMHDRIPESLTAFYPDHDRWYEVRTYPAENGIAVYFNNVTEQIQVQEALRLSEARFRRIFECNMIGMGTWTRSGGITEANDAFLDVIGYTRQDFDEGRLNWQEITVPEQAERDQQAIAEIERRGICSPFEKEYIHKQGHRVPILLGAAGFVDTSEAGFFFTVDLSDRKQAEELLRQSESHLRLMIESAKDYAIFTLDLNGIVTKWNAGAERLLQYSEAEIIGYNSRIIFTPEDREKGKSEQELQIALTQGRAKNERWHLRKDSSRFWGSGLVMPLQDEAGNVQGFVKIMQDKTTQRQAEAERGQLLQREQAARETAERANQIKDEFLAVLSHELRSPLNPILGWTQLLQKGKLDATRQREALATIERNARLQTQLIEDLLDISRIMQGKLSLNPTPTSLAFVISAAVETVRLAAEAKHLAIALDLDSQIAPVFGDAARLQQVVWNLLTNAVKFTPAGGQVMIELRQADQLAQIRVIDTGIGINAQFLPYVFEYFRQEDGSTTRKFGGLGLGLAIVRQIVELHGGTVKVESQGEDQGTTFIVQLPTLQQTAPTLVEPGYAQPDSETLLANVQILLVDDDTDTREFQAFLLEQHGATVTAVASGLAALQALEQFIPNVIVSDIGMAEMDGYRLMQQIRSRPPAQGGTVPAIALTAYAAEIDQEKALQAGFQTHLTKPLEPERFVSEIMTLLKPNRV